MSVTPAGLPLWRHETQLDGPCVKIAGLPPGTYRLDVFPCQSTQHITVVPPPHSAAGPAPRDVIIGSHAMRHHRGCMLPLSLDHPLHVRHFHCSAAEGIKVSLRCRILAPLQGCGRSVRASCFVLGIRLHVGCAARAAAAQRRIQPQHACHSVHSVQAKPCASSCTACKHAHRIATRVPGFARAHGPMHAATSC